MAALLARAEELDIRFRDAFLEDLVGVLFVLFIGFEVDDLHFAHEGWPAVTEGVGLLEQRGGVGHDGEGEQGNQK